MGVLPCKRQNCENVMAEYYSESWGYLCADCKEELLKTPWVSIEKFLEGTTTPAEYSAWVDYIDRMYELRWEE
jgi:hypothetical protein